MWDVGWIRVYPTMLFVLVLGMSSGSVVYERKHLGLEG